MRIDQTDYEFNGKDACEKSWDKTDKVPCGLSECKFIYSFSNALLKFRELLTYTGTGKGVLSIRVSRMLTRNRVGFVLTRGTISPLHGPRNVH